MEKEKNKETVLESFSRPVLSRSRELDVLGKSCREDWRTAALAWEVLVTDNPQGPFTAQTPEAQKPKGSQCERRLAAAGNSQF